MTRKTSPAQLLAVQRYKQRNKHLARLYRYRSACRALIRLASVDELQQIIELAEKQIKSKSE